MHSRHPRGTVPSREGSVGGLAAVVSGNHGKKIIVSHALRLKLPLGRTHLARADWLAREMCECSRFVRPFVLVSSFPTPLVRSPSFSSSHPLSPSLPLHTTLIIPAMDNDFAQTAIEGPKQFIKDGVAFINRCTKPDRKGTEHRCCQEITYSASSWQERVTKGPLLKTPLYRQTSRTLD